MPARKIIYALVCALMVAAGPSWATPSVDEIRRLEVEAAGQAFDEMIDEIARKARSNPMRIAGLSTQQQARLIDIHLRDTGVHEAYRIDPIRMVRYAQCRIAAHERYERVMRDPALLDRVAQHVSSKPMRIAGMRQQQVERAIETWAIDTGALEPLRCVEPEALAQARTEATKRSAAP